MDQSGCASANINTIVSQRETEEDLQVEEFNLDFLIQQIGTFGKFQKKILLLICITDFFMINYSMMFIFTAGEVEYRCRIPGCDSNNSSLQASFLNFTTPSDKNGFSKCKKFMRLPKSLEDQCQAQFFDQNHTELCSELIYDQDEITIQNEWNLGCSEEWKLSLVGTVNSLGQLVCFPLVGLVSDRFGRRTAFIWSCFLAAFLGLLKSFSTNYIMFIILEFLGMALGSGIFISGFLLGVEFVGPEKRAFFDFWLCMACSIGSINLGILAMVVKEWRILTRILYLPCFIFTSYYWFVPESVKWLYGKNRTTEAANVIASVAKTNRIQFTSKAKAMLEHIGTNQQPSNVGKMTSIEAEEHRLMSILKSRTLLLRIVICSFNWAAIYFAYTGLNMDSVLIAGDKYVNFILNILIEIPANLVSWWLMEKLGRRRILCMSQITCGLACIACIFLKGAPVAVQTIAFLVGKFSASVSYVVIILYTSELFPTALRHTLYSFCQILGSIGSIMAPFTLYLGKYMESMEMILFAATTIPAGISILFAPETLNKPLPDTILEAENIDKK